MPCMNMVTPNVCRAVGTPKRRGTPFVAGEAVQVIVLYAHALLHLTRLLQLGFRPAAEKGQG